MTRATASCRSAGQNALDVLATFRTRSALNGSRFEDGMALPWSDLPGATADGSTGYTYGAVAVRAADQRDRLLSALRAIRFSGWIAPPDDAWVLAVPARAGGAGGARPRGVPRAGAGAAPGAGT